MKNSSVKPATILIVDDEEIILKTLYFDLQSQGYNVVMASDGDVALEKLKAQSFDLVISDLAMDGLAGIDLLKKVKELYPQTATLVLSGFGDWTVDFAVLEAYVDDYLLKPCQPREMHFRIRRCLQQRELRERLRHYESNK